jgi:hypothetical protein
MQQDNENIITVLTRGIQTVVWYQPLPVFVWATVCMRCKLTVRLSFWRTGFAIFFIFSGRNHQTAEAIWNRAWVVGHMVSNGLLRHFLLQSASNPLQCLLSWSGNTALFFSPFNHVCQLWVLLGLCFTFIYTGLSHCSAVNETILALLKQQLVHVFCELNFRAITQINGMVFWFCSRFFFLP